MSKRSQTPFDSIENSHEYVAMLAEAITEAQADVDAEIRISQREHAQRKTEALQLVSYKLLKLQTHMATSRRILNDLRSLRILLLEERSSPLAAEHKATAPSEKASGAVG